MNKRADYRNLAIRLDEINSDIDRIRKGLSDLDDEFIELKELELRISEEPKGESSTCLRCGMRWSTNSGYCIFCEAELMDRTVYSQLFSRIDDVHTAGDIDTIRKLISDLQDDISQLKEAELKLLLERDEIEDEIFRIEDEE